MINERVEELVVKILEDWRPEGIQASVYGVVSVHHQHGEEYEVDNAYTILERAIPHVLDDIALNIYSDLIAREVDELYITPMDIVFASEEEYLREPTTLKSYLTRMLNTVQKVRLYSSISMTSFAASNLKGNDDEIFVFQFNYMRDTGRSTSIKLINLRDATRQIMTAGAVL